MYNYKYWNSPLSKCKLKSQIISLRDGQNKTKQNQVSILLPKCGINKETYTEVKHMALVLQPSGYTRILCIFEKGKWGSGWWGMLVQFLVQEWVFGYYLLSLGLAICLSFRDFPKASDIFGFSRQGVNEGKLKIDYK